MSNPFLNTPLPRPQPRDGHYDVVEMDAYLAQQEALLAATEEGRHNQFKLASELEQDLSKIAESK